MNELIIFYSEHGFALTLIAILGIIVLGALKYAEVFSKLSEDIRHLIYIAISVGLSLGGGAIYLVCIKSFAFNYFMLFAGSVFALNQTFYNIFKATTLNDLIKKILEKFVLFITKKDD